MKLFIKKKMEDDDLLNGLETSEEDLLLSNLVTDDNQFQTDIPDNTTQKPPSLDIVSDIMSKFTPETMESLLKDDSCKDLLSQATNTIKNLPAPLQKQMIQGIRDQVSKNPELKSTVNNASNKGMTKSQYNRQKKEMRVESQMQKKNEDALASLGIDCKPTSFMPETKKINKKIVVLNNNRQLRERTIDMTYSTIYINDFIKGEKVIITPITLLPSCLSNRKIFCHYDENNKSRNKRASRMLHKTVGGVFIFIDEENDLTENDIIQLEKFLLSQK